MWFVFAVISGLCYTVSGLMSRHVLKAYKDAWAFSFYFSAVGAVVSAPFALVSFFAVNATATEGSKAFFQSIPISTWLLLLVVGGMIVGHNLLNFASTKYLEPSMQGVIQKLRLVWGFLFGMVFLHEAFSMNKLVATLATVMAGILIIRKIKRPDSVRGVMLSAVATVVYVSVLVFYKLLFKYFSSNELTFFIFLIPAVLNLILMPNRLSRIRELYNHQGFVVLLACTAGGFANLAMNAALSMGEVSKVPVVIDSLLVATLVGEFFVLKERSYLKEKVIAALLALASAVLMR